jgi:thiol:disulfide interchange protein DsbA
MFKKLFSIAVISLLSSSVFAADYQAGKDYEVLPTPIVTADKSKVEVVEVFWFGCGHCYTFEAPLHAWVEKQAADVNFVQMPAIWNAPMIGHAKAFYTAKALGVSKDVNPAIFTAMNVQRNRLANEAAIAKIFIAQGVDAETFSKTYNSFGVSSQVKLSESRAKSYRIQGTPEMVVNGKYRVSSSMTGSQEAMLEVANFLIAKERATLAK